MSSVTQRPEPVRLTDLISIGVLTRLVNRDLVDEILAETGRREKRSRLLPARVVVYYVMALALFYSENYEEVMRRLVGGLVFTRAWRTKWHVPTAGAISQARARLGEQPMRALFERVAVPMCTAGAVGAWYGPWRVMAVDGVVLSVPDTPANDEAFGRVHAVTPDPFPQVRVVGLGECGSHAIVAAALGPARTGERDLTRQILPFLGPDMLLLADRGFFGYDLWKQTRATGAQLLWRVQRAPALPVLEWLPDDSYRSQLLPAQINADLQKGRRRNIAPGVAFDVRVITYTVTNRDGTHEDIRLVTSVTDHTIAPAADLAALYAQRWEFEIALDEIETHQIGPRILRSKTPDLVRQEIWALLLTHYAIRDLIREAADDIDIDPDRLSFLRSLRVIRRHVTDEAAFPPQTTHPSNPTSHP